MFLAIAKIAFCAVTTVLAFLSQVPLLGFDFHTMSTENYLYSPALLIVFMLSTLFRNNYTFMALVSILLAVFAGLPLFSFGGGWQYILEPSFGYIFALYVMSVSVFYNFYHTEEQNERKINALFLILGANVFGMVFYMVFNHLEFIPFKMFFTQLFYDLIFAMIFVWLLPKRNLEATQ